MGTWQEVKDDQGRTYYYNPVTQETSWENPDVSSLASSWKSYRTEDGREYYYNEASGETTWDKPAELEEASKDGTKETDETVQETEDLVEDAAEKLTERDAKLAKEAVKVSVLLNPPVFESSKEAHEAFFEMLAQENVDSTWSFEKVIERFVQNPVYWSIPDASERKSLYDEYLLRKLQQESQDKTKLIETFKRNFVQVLEEYRNNNKLTATTRWSTLKSMLIEEENPIFKHSVLPDAEIAKIFHDFVENFTSEEKRKLQEKKDQALTELDAYLSQLISAQKSHDLTWETLYKRLQNDARFKANKHFQVLTKTDMLDLYRNKIYPKIVEEIMKEVVIARKRNYRSDRKARQAFKALMAKVTINANTLFQDVLPQLEDEDEFIEICGRNGSTPLELFWDIVDEKRQILKVKKDLVEHSIADFKAQNPHVFEWETLINDKDRFIDALKSIKDDRLSSFDFTQTDKDSELYIIYDSLKNEHILQQQKNKIAYEENLARGIKSLAEWMMQDLSAFVFIKVRKEGDIVPEDDEESDTVIEINSRGIAKLVKNEPQSSEWKKSLGDKEKFTEILHLIEEHHKEAPEQVEKALSEVIGKCIDQIVILSTQSRKRKLEPYSRDTVSEAKRVKSDKEKKPILMNY
ncbi:FF domain family protein [Clavispora lusitaniae]|uniref:FF domain family protein n=1 Tax=Clavispora lusitaniae TaxID=36911 RepID=UPI0016AB1AFF|nr:hypothetical protein E0198_002217 [Clavispora lusitaniae]KAF7579732.1 FF domain family protein [Clavispora lusitaniae]